MAILCDLCALCGEFFWVDHKPWVAVEAKLSATSIEPSLTYFRDRLRIPWVYQVVLEGKRDFVQNDIRCIPARQFLGALV